MTLDSTNSEYQLARDYSEVMEKILQAFADIATFLPRLDRLKATFEDNADFEFALGLIYSDMVEFHRRAYKFFRRKAWHIWFAFDWGIFERRFKSILEKLRSHCDLLDREAAAVHFSEMKSMRIKREADEQHFELRRRLQSAQEVFGWLSAEEDSQEECLHRISDNRQPGTCNWILEDQMIRSWIEDDNGETVVWLTAIPGAGKTYLCSLLIQNLETHQDLSSTYYFCRHQLSEKTTCATILRTMTIQLLKSHPDMTELVHQAYLQKNSSLSYPAIKKMLKEILVSVSNTRMILDGIDECNQSTQREVLGCLLDFHRHTGGSCKLLISSREDPLIGKTMPPQMHHIKLGERTTDGLNIFIENKLKELKEYFPWLEPEVANLVQRRLQDRAKGMFLWVRLVCTTLQQQTSEIEFERAIEELPDGLDEAYGLILTRFCNLSPALKDRVLRILFWLSVAYRSISIHEVADGIALYPGQIHLTKKTRTKDLDRDVVEICAPLLEKSSNGNLDLVHFSAKEYLLHKQSGPFIDIAQAHFNIAFSCIANLISTLVIVPLHHDGASPAVLESRVIQGNYGLQPYAHHFWAEHVRAYLEHARELDPELNTLIDALQSFSRVCRNQSPNYFEHLTRPTSQPGLKGLDKLQNVPFLYNFVSGWLRFKLKIQSMEALAGDFQSQKDWQLRADETYLSLIDNRLQEVAEQLLAMKATALPPHIDPVDYQAFTDRFVFECRFIHCSNRCNSASDRDAHERAHAVSFPCLQCDFSERGFKSRKDLDRHTRIYHTSAKDFEIPPRLSDITTDCQNRYNLGSGRYSGPTLTHTCWNDQGRKVLQTGFRQVLAKIEAELALADHTAEYQSSVDQSHGKNVGLERRSSFEEDSSASILKSIRAKVEGQQYETLTDFRDDVRELSRVPKSMVEPRFGGRLEAICDHEFEKVITDFPAFADLESGGPKLVTGTTGLAGALCSPQKILDSPNNPENAFASTSSLGKKKPYWSATEEKSFPELLEQCGRDFMKIADYLKTKSIDIIKQHFADLVSSGRTDLLKVADAADARLKHDLESFLSKPDNMDPEVNEPLSGDSLQDVGLGGSVYSAETLEAMSFYRSHQKDPFFRKSNTRSDEDNKNKTVSSIMAEDSESSERPKRSARRPRQKAICPYCKNHSGGFHDEYTLQKHFDRFHRATRQVWFCDDISIDKKFLANCEPCSDGKRYSSKHNASKHLRASHFDATASVEKLSRWTRKTEEPNPNFDHNESQPNSDVTRLYLPRQGGKRLKMNGKSFSNNKPSLSNYSDLLPSMRSTPKQLGASSPTSSLSVILNPDQDLDEDEVEPSNSSSEDDLESFEQTLLLPDVSFDNFLPGAAQISHSIDITAPPHQKIRALIKPEQVQRLPHLNQSRKLACQDQVEALYQTLETQYVGGKGYQEALENLTSLSRKLLSDLMDWRRRSTLAPTIPFSI